MSPFVCLHCNEIAEIDPEFLAQLKQLVNELFSPDRLVPKVGANGQAMTCRNWLLFVEVCFFSQSLVK